MNERTARVVAEFEALGIDAFFTMAPENRRYLTGFTGSSGYVIVSAGETVLLTDSRYTVQAKLESEANSITVVQHGSGFLDAVQAYVDRVGGRRIGFEAHGLTHQTYLDLTAGMPGVEWTPTARVIERARQVKDQSELARMKEAARIADAAFEHIAEFIRPGLTEREVALELEVFMRQRGAEGVAFETIVASGERSALPHGVATDRRIGRGEFVTLDFGAMYDGYASDITRTLAVGNPSPRHREIYEVVLEAQQKALEGIRAGMTGAAADALARSAIADAGYGERFGHSLGHGLGLAVHESPRLAKSSGDVLAPGMTVTVEPGVYIPGFGGVRIEDDIVVAIDGNERLTRATKELLIL